ncbi:hypothetical protein BDA96_02G151100 [Sorghum bicolor]|uniref:Uncharacterized protein n=1 Tax=Sorghum bicolor TaxID=4558 RepID=A0A921RM69_SORBI|nr:hypothetical protein BDA96_02G151100 [Sorghum bicolor]
MVVVRPTAGGNKYICYTTMVRDVREGVRLVRTNSPHGDCRADQHRPPGGQEGAGHTRRAGCWLHNSCLCVPDS